MARAATAAARAPRGRFYANSALVMLAAVLLAFPLTYYGPLLSGSRRFAPFYHVHGLAFFAWIGLYAWQTHLAASGRIARHREFGLAGIALSALMLPLGVIMAIAAIRHRMALGDPHPFDVTIYNIVDIATFSLMMIASIAAVTATPTGTAASPSPPLCAGSARQSRAGSCRCPRRSHGPT